MIGIGMLFCLILVNLIGGIDGAVKEADNGKNDLLFEQMWRKAFESNWHNGKEGEEKEMAKGKEEQPEEGENQIRKKVKRGRTIEKEENELWKKVKKQKYGSTSDQKASDQSAADDDQKMVETELDDLLGYEWKDLLSKLEGVENDRQQKDDSTSDQKASDQSTVDDGQKMVETELDDLLGCEWEDLLGIEREENWEDLLDISDSEKTSDQQPKTSDQATVDDDQVIAESEERKWEIIKEFDKMRKECQMKGAVKRADRAKIEREIAKKLGTSRKNIYQWKNELNTQKEEISEERKIEIIKEFDKMRKEYQMRGEYKRKSQHKIEQEIAKALGTYREKIYQWKKQLNRKMKAMRRLEGEESAQQQMYGSASDQNEFDHSTAPDDKKMETELYDLLDFEWEDLLSKLEGVESDQQQKDGSTSDQKASDQATVDDGQKVMEIELEDLLDYEWEDLLDISDPEESDQEQKALGQSTANDDQKIECEPKKLQKKKPAESEERIREIVEKFDKMRKESQMRGEYNDKTRAKIEQEIAKALGTYRDKIYKWKKELNSKKEEISEERKLEIIKEFDKMRKEHQMKEDYKWEDRVKIEEEIAKKLGTTRRNIYQWKNELKTKNEAIKQILRKLFLS